ncbi:MAG: tripartite tricarboxylate transporter permease [Candidatus Pacearchaeota archaeon]|nr:tripartite tricarboxylate transporter permease [Candidatus Pacearchaeota archaeon]
MLIELILFMLLGILAGTITGLTPGIHINLVGALLVGISATILSAVNPFFLVIFIAAMAITHTFVDFIPSIFLGCPDSETQLSVLPGHEMLREGKGYEAVMLSAQGGIIASIILMIIAIPLSLLVPKVYSPINSIMPIILILTSAILIFGENKRISALFVFAVSGILGLCVLNMNIKEPLLPLLSGLFGSSMLVTSIRTKVKLPPQQITKSKEKVLRPIIGSIIASPLCGFLPGLGSGQAAILGNSLLKTERKGFLILVGATNILVMGISFISIYAISKTRTGAAAAIHQIIGTLSWQMLAVILVCVLITGIISFFLVKFLAEILSQKIAGVNYSLLSIMTLVFLTIIVVVFSGFLGLIVLAISTITGIYCNQLNVRKTEMMGCLLVPTIILYLF